MPEIIHVVTLDSLRCSVLRNIVRLIKVLQEGTIDDSQFITVYAVVDLLIGIMAPFSYIRKDTTMVVACRSIVLVTFEIISGHVLTYKQCVLSVTR